MGNSKRESVPVYVGKLANILLTAGYTIASVAPNRAMPERSVFYFKPESGIHAMIGDFIDKNGYNNYKSSDKPSFKEKAAGSYDKDGKRGCTTAESNTDDSL